MYQKDFFWIYWFSRVDRHTKHNKRRWVWQRLVSQKSEFAYKIYSLLVKFQDVKFTDPKFKIEIFVRIDMKHSNYFIICLQSDC